MMQKLWIALLHTRQVQGELCHADVEAVFLTESAAKSHASHASTQLTLEIDGQPCYAQRSIVPIELEDVCERIWIALIHARQIGGSFCHSQAEEVFTDEDTAKDFESIKPEESVVEIDGISCFARRRIIPYDLKQD